MINKLLDLKISNIRSSVDYSPCVISLNYKFLSESSTNDELIWTYKLDEAMKISNNKNTDFIDIVGNYVRYYYYDLTIDIINTMRAH